MTARPFRQMINIPAELPDGVALSVDLRLPMGDGPFPAVLMRTPYNKSRDSDNAEILGWIDAGYAVVMQDCRGCHESEGTYDPFIQEIADGHDTVAWVASQSWCDGRVAMTGGSYVGWTQLAAAAGGHEALKAISPAVMGPDPYHHIAFQGGSIRLFMLWWMIHNDGRSQRNAIGFNWSQHYRHLPVAEMDVEIGCPSPSMHKWIAHPARDAFWQAISVADRLDRTRAAMLLLGGWYDPFNNGLIDTFCTLRDRRADDGREVRMIIGPWGHGINSSRTMGDLDFGESALIELEAQRRAFVDAHVKGDARVTTGPAATVFVTGLNAWRELDGWPPAEARPRELRLAGGGRANSLVGDGALVETLPADNAECDSYTYDPNDPVPSIGGASLMISQGDGPMDQRPAERRDDVLCYTSGTLDKPLEVMGRIRVRLFVSSSALDTDFIARLCDLRSDGKSVYVCDGVLRMRFREGFDRQVMMTPGEIYEIEIDLGHAAHRFVAGHALRLEVTSSCMPRFERNLNTGGENAAESEPVVAVQKIFHDAERPSMVILDAMDAAV